MYNEHGEPLAEIIKIQLKSTEKDNSYVRLENDVKFTFYAEKSHVEYWQKLSYDILLVIYDNRRGNNKLYAKKIENIDLKNMGTINVPIQFHKEKDLLDSSKNDFLNKFSRSLNKINPKIKPTSTGIEKLISNLLKISFPTNEIYIADINYDRDDIIKKSWETDWKLKRDSTERKVAQNALFQQGLKFSSDWTIANKQIITFHNLNNTNLPLSKIINIPAEKINLEEFYTDSDDKKNIFKALIRYCLQQILYKLNFEWDTEDKIFKYKVPFHIDKNLEYKERWKGDKEAKRTVFKSKYWEKGKIYYCTHFAFSIDIMDFDDEFYLCINPTWLVTINGNQKSKVGHKKVSQLKKLERNKAVYNHLRFISFKLMYRDLFTSEYPFIQFESLINVKLNQIIDDDEWIKKEEDEEKNLLEDTEEPNDIKDENTLFK